MKTLNPIILWLAAVLFCGSPSVFAVNAGYNFDGDFNNTFSVVGSGDGSWAQSGGVAEFTSISGAATDQTLVWQSYQMPYDTDWTLTLDVTIPSFYDTALTDPDTGDEYVDVLLAVQHETMTEEFVATAGLTVKTDDNVIVERLVFGEFIYQDSALFTSSFPTSATTLNVMLAYSSALEQITASYDGSNILYTLPVGAAGDPDWGMNAGDFFNVGISASNNFQQVFSANPASVDNLSASGASAIPEPTSAALIAALAALLLKGVKRRF